MLYGLVALCPDPSCQLALLPSAPTCCCAAIMRLPCRCLFHLHAATRAAGRSLLQDSTIEFTGDDTGIAVGEAVISLTSPLHPH